MRGVYAPLWESLAAGVVDISYLTNDSNADCMENSNAEEDDSSNESEESELGSSDSKKGSSSSEKHNEIEYESHDREDKLESSDSEAETEKWLGLQSKADMEGLGLMLVELEVKSLLQLEIRLL